MAAAGSNAPPAGELVIRGGRARRRNDQVGVQLGDGLEVGLEQRADGRELGVLGEVLGQHGFGDANDGGAETERVQRVEGGQVEGDDAGGPEGDLDALGGQRVVDHGLVRGGGVVAGHECRLGVLHDDGRSGDGLGFGRAAAGAEPESGDDGEGGGDR